jgi:hypothetical protein
MFESLTGGTKENAITLLKGDHDKVKELFDQFENTDSLAEKKKIAAQAIMELKIHAEIEEKIFYPAVREKLDDEDIMNEADEEHHVAKLLIGELDQMDGSEDHWEAKFTVLAENIRHHIREEENEMLPKARNEDIDFEMLGQKLLRAKQQLKQNGVPESDEGKLMARSKARADSPAKAAKAKPQRRSASKRKPASRKPGKSSKSSRSQARSSSRSQGRSKKTASRTQSRMSQAKRRRG